MTLALKLPSASFTLAEPLFIISMNSARWTSPLSTATLSFYTLHGVGAVPAHRGHSKRQLSCVGTPLHTHWALYTTVPSGASRRAGLEATLCDRLSTHPKQVPTTCKYHPHALPVWSLLTSVMAANAIARLTVPSPILSRMR
jgi:hypothetical protein